MYYNVSLAKFGNCCSMVWARRQGQLKGRKFSLSFSEEGSKSVMHCFTMYFWTWFSIPAYYNSPGYQNFPSASMSCYSGDLAQLLSCLDLWSPWSKNISENKFLPLASMVSAKSCSHAASCLAAVYWLWVWSLLSPLSSICVFTGWVPYCCHSDCPGLFVGPRPGLGYTTVV